MENLTVASLNVSQVPNIIINFSHMWNIVKLTSFILVAIFLYFILKMLKAFFTTAGLRENSRCILFAFLMVNDTIYTFICLLLFLFVWLVLTIPTLFCAVLVGLSSLTFYNTPNGLAAMALERYVAICYPLRHAEICRVERSLIVIVMFCVIGFLPYLFDFFILVSTEKQNFMFQKIMCSREAIFSTTLQTVLRSVSHGCTFTLVTLVLIYTYIRIVLEAKKINKDSILTSKASKTVILHAVQLLLCMASFTYPITQNHFENNSNLRVFNMLAFMILPRCLSPLIYGLRDEAFRNHVKLCLCRPRWTLPNTFQS